MKTCIDCIHYERCDTIFDGLLSNRNNEPCDQFDDKAYYVKPPAYIGQKVWVPVAWYNQTKKEIISEVREGKISMLQQKADKSWKFRVTTKYVADYTLDDIGEYIFFTKEAAEEDLAKQIKKLEAQHNVN
jgi:hypothetical protein